MLNGSDDVIEASVDLSNVAHDDQTIIKDVCAVLAALKRTLRIKEISVTAAGDIYNVTATISGSTAVEIAKSDMDTIVDINPLRVTGVSVVTGEDSPLLKVRVCSLMHPVTITDTQIVKVVKKRRWGLF